MLLPCVLNSTESAECAEIASIVIELVIGILLSPANNYMPFVQHYKLHHKLLCLKICNHYMVITFGFSITTTLKHTHAVLLVWGSLRIAPIILLQVYIELCVHNLYSVSVAMYTYNTTGSI